MLERPQDQAAGLRRLFASPLRPARLLFAGSPPPQALLVALARQLASAGKAVLLVDARGGGEGVAARLGLHPRFDLQQAARGDVTIRRVCLSAESAIRLLPAARAGSRFARLGADERQAIDACLRREESASDFVLIDAAAAAIRNAPPLWSGARQVILGVGAEANSITEAYRLVKQLAHSGNARRFGVVVQAPRAASARAVFANLAAVAERHLGARLEYLGSDHGLADAPPRADPATALAESLLAVDAGFATPWPPARDEPGRASATSAMV